MTQATRTSRLIGTPRTIAHTLDRGLRAAGPALLILVVLPAFVRNPFLLRILTVAWLLSTLAVGLSLTVGFAGIFNMSQGTMYGIGAYTVAIVVTRTGMPLEIAIVAAVLVTTTVGVILGFTAIRVRGDYWSLVSMAFTLGAVKIFENWRTVTGGKDGFVGIPPLSLMGLSLSDPTSAYYAALGTLALSYFFVYRIARSFTGRAMLAIRHDELAAGMMGVSVSRMKILALALSSGIAALAGGVLVGVNQFIAPPDFGFIPSFNILLFVIVGGLTSLNGAVLATTFLTFVTEFFRGVTEFRLMILGGATVLAVFFRAGVFAPILRPLARAINPTRLARVLIRRRGRSSSTRVGVEAQGSDNNPEENRLDA